MIIRQGKSHVAGCYADVDPTGRATFVVSSKEWIDNEFGVEYIKEVFDKYSRTKLVHSYTILRNCSAGRETRLLILDGYNSHMNPGFLIYTVEHDIIVLCPPSSTSHVIRLLDVESFSQLQR
ncbi:hypothetical protein P167DRAFT_591889 [Morchella conica CCBAS932]|uniref:DDE-1 domain-containing protein n=1 Tax=Morchella conica CCBAS932 TaxID=1392247 RepID=A0A3N4KMV7_9PEZI|nr:hypothetical protein P167DRAFT_591889 [Morchella conica CCBAS932]